MGFSAGSAGRISSQQLTIKLDSDTESTIKDAATEQGKTVGITFSTEEGEKTLNFILKKSTHGTIVGSFIKFHVENEGLFHADDSSISNEQRDFIASKLQDYLNDPIADSMAYDLQPHESTFQSVEPEVTIPDVPEKEVWQHVTLTGADDVDKSLFEDQNNKAGLMGKDSKIRQQWAITKQTASDAISQGFRTFLSALNRAK